MSIFNFNHIDRNKTKEEIQEGKEVNILGDTIIDFCPLVTKFEKTIWKKIPLYPHY